MVTRGRTTSTAGKSASRSPSTSTSRSSTTSSSPSSSSSSSRGRTTSTAGTTASRSPTTTSTIARVATTTATPITTVSEISRGQERFTDPSVLSGLITNPFSEIGQAIYGPISDFGEAVQETIIDPVTDFLSPITEPITDVIFPEEPEVPIVPEVPIEGEVTCPARVQIVSNITNVVAGEGLFNCATIDRYKADPDYRIIYLDTEERIPTEEPEPDVPEQMQFLCSDVYTLDAGRVVKTSYPTLSVQQIQNFINQGLMIRDCGTPSPTVNEVRSHYGYAPEVPVEEVPDVPTETTADIPPPDMETEPEVPVVTVPTEKFVVSKPGRLTMSDMTNTNAWVGILIAGTLAVPVFSSILSKRK